MQIAIFEQNIGQISIHKINGNHTAIRETRANHFQVIKLGEIQNTVFKMYLKNQLVTH